MDLIWLLFVLLIVLEHISPDQPLKIIKQRWVTNFSLLFVSLSITYILNLAFSSIVADHNGPSGFLTTLDIKAFFSFLFLFFLLDFFYYLLHRVTHYHHLLWRFHCVHHSDLDIDLSTNFRHHPLELTLTWMLLFAVVWLIGIEPVVMGAFAAVSYIIQMWHHSNIKMNATFDNYLGYLLVTPRIHRVHHCAYKPYTDSNYGMIFTIWDRIFGTFTSPDNLKKPTRYGLEYFTEPRQQSFIGVLMQPFVLRKKSKSKSKNLRGQVR